MNLGRHKILSAQKAVESETKGFMTTTKNNKKTDILINPSVELSSNNCKLKN